MPEFHIADEQIRVLAHLLEELTDRDILNWTIVDTNCFIARIGAQEFSFSQWPDGLETNLGGTRFRSYEHGLSELRDAVYRQQDRESTG